MEWLLLILPLAMLLYIFALAATWCARIGSSYVLEGLAEVRESFSEQAARMAEAFEQRAERKRVERRFAVAAGGSGAVDHDAAKAVQQMPTIRRLLDQVLPRAVIKCLRIHRLSAAAMGARYIREVAFEPECWGSRQRVVAVAAVAMQLLEKYPYFVEDEALMANLIVLRAHVVPTCSNCPYLQHRVQSAPLLCPTARTMQIDPERVGHDAE